MSSRENIDYDLCIIHFETWWKMYKCIIHSKQSHLKLPLIYTKKLKRPGYISFWVFTVLQIDTRCMAARDFLEKFFNFQFLRNHVFMWNKNNSLPFVRCFIWALRFADSRVTSFVLISICMSIVHSVKSTNFFCY